MRISAHDTVRVVNPPPTFSALHPVPLVNSTVSTSSSIFITSMSATCAAVTVLYHDGHVAVTVPVTTVNTLSGKLSITESSTPVTSISVPVVVDHVFDITTVAGTVPSPVSDEESAIVTSDPSPVAARSLKLIVAVDPSSPVSVSVRVTTIPGASLS